MIRATLTFVLEYEDEDITGDPAETLLEILAGTRDSDLLECITVETIKEVES